MLFLLIAFLYFQQQIGFWIGLNRVLIETVCQSSGPVLVQPGMVMKSHGNIFRINELISEEAFG